jgi:putative transposase
VTRTSVAEPVRHVRAQVYAAELTTEQAASFTVIRAGATWFFNEAARSQLDRSRHHKGIESFMSLAYAVRAARDAGVTYWHEGQEHPITGVPARMLHGTLRQLAASWTRHLAMRKAGRRSRPPGFRSMRRGGSLYWQVQEDGGPQPLAKLIKTSRPGHAVMHVPGIGPVRVRYHRELPADTMARFAGLRVDDTGRYWVTVQYDTAQVRQPAPDGVAGIDRGVIVTLATSDGDVYEAPGLSAGQAARKARLQRTMSRKRRLSPCAHDHFVTRGGRTRLLRGHCPDPGMPGADCRCWKHSRRYQQAKVAYLRLSQRETWQRRNGAHMASRALADRYAVIVAEDLDVSAMTSSAKGTPEEPGRNVRQKAGLNREILAANWYQMEQFIAYKTQLAKVPAPHTSQTCPGCGHVSPGNRPDRDTFRCERCGLAGHADVIAACNIRNRYTAGAPPVAARETCLGVSQQPANQHQLRQFGKRSHAGQVTSIAQDVSGYLIPAGWGRGSARIRVRIRRPRAPARARPGNAA